MSLNYYYISIDQRHSLLLYMYYKTKCEVSGEVAPLNFLTNLYQIQNYCESAIIHLDWPDIG